jgi:phenylacetate-CoA ligase
MEKVTGRTDDMIILRGVNVFPTQIEELVLGVEGLSPHFQLHLTRPERLDVMTVKVEARPGFSGRVEAGEALRKAVKDTVGVSVEIDVVDPETLERSVGKLRRVIDRRGG